MIHCDQLPKDQFVGVHDQLMISFRLRKCLDLKTLNQVAFVLTLTVALGI